MKGRCYNPNNRDFEYYGGRGIKICERWMKFENFYADMGERPPRYTIERADNNGDYQPGNCCWATRERQSNNTRRSVLVEYQGQHFTVGELAKKLGTTRNVLAYGLKIGLPVEQATIRRPPAGRYSKKRRTDVNT